MNNFVAWYLNMVKKKREMTSSNLCEEINNNNWTSENRVCIQLGLAESLFRALALSPSFHQYFCLSACLFNLIQKVVKKVQ